MKNLLATLIMLFFVYGNNIIAQCSIEILPNKNEVVCGDELALSLEFYGAINLDNDFNLCNLGAGWTSNFNVQYSVDCVESLDGSCYAWTDTITGGPRYISTPSFFLEQNTRLKFDMKYGVQSGIPSPCEGIDLPDEGVYVEYQIDGVWDTLKYYNPNGGFDDWLTTWHTYELEIPIPSGGKLVKLRWIQLKNSTPAHDQWGLDNIKVYNIDPNAYFKWRHLSDTTLVDITERPVESKWYHVTYFTENESCEDSIYIPVRNLNTEIKVFPNDSICIGDEIQFKASNEVEDNNIDYCGISTVNCNYWHESKKIRITSDSVYDENSAWFDKANIFGDVFDAQQRTQVIIQAQDLKERNFRKGIINSLSLFIDDIGYKDSTITEFFHIKIGCTNVNEFDTSHTWIEDGLSEVGLYENRKLTTSWNKFDFDLPYAWDGVSNLVVDFCEYTFKDSSWTSTESRGIHTWDHHVDYNTTLHKYKDKSTGSCSFEIDWKFDEFINSRRPMIDFEICQPREITMDYQWKADSTLSNDTIFNPVASPSTNNVYVVTTNGKGFPEICAITDSVEVVVFDNNETIQIDTVICNGDSILIGNSYAFSQGIYKDTVVNNAGCDWYVEYDLTVIDKPDTSVVLMSDTLKAVQNNVSYQWYDCNTDSIIAGANQQTFLPTRNGSYRVLLANDACQYMSNCHEVLLTNIAKQYSIESVQIYPNPVIHNKFNIDNSGDKQITLTIYNMVGKMIFSEVISQHTTKQLLLDVSPGSYFYKLKAGNEEKIGKLIFK